MRLYRIFQPAALLFRWAFPLLLSLLCNGETSRGECWWDWRFTWCASIWLRSDLLWWQGLEDKLIKKLPSQIATILLAAWVQSSLTSWTDDFPDKSLHIFEEEIWILLRNYFCRACSIAQLIPDSANNLVRIWLSFKFYLKSINGTGSFHYYRIFYRW